MTFEEITSAGYEIKPASYSRLEKFVELLLHENQKINLTAIRDVDAVWRRHVCESLALLPLLDEFNPSRVLDLGTGGGVPGVVLACVREDVEYVLLDATRKKLHAVERIIAELELEWIRTIWGRAEELAHDAAHREVFDIVTARAVAALPTLVEYAAGFVRPGGGCWFVKSVEGAAREVETALGAAEKCGLQYERTHRYSLPGESEDSAVVIYTKTTRLRKELPRSQGLARRKPF